MSEKMNTTEEVTTTPTVETVSKEEYDNLVKDYKRVVAAYNKAIIMLGNTYVDNLSKSILEEVDKDSLK